MASISNHSCRIFVIGVQDLKKTNTFLNLAHHQPDTNKIYQYAKDFYEWMYQYLIDKSAWK